MSVLNFDKEKLGNLEYSLRREMLSTNRSGGYMSTTIVCCNTRKYHGLMVCPLSELNSNSNYVLLSSLDETVESENQSFNLAIHRFPGIYEPRGHKYVTDFAYTPTPTITYKIGGATLRKEILWIHSRRQLLVRYSLLESTSAVKLKLRPFLAFRDSHSLSSANMVADGRSYTIESGVKCRLYDGFPWLNMQINKDNEFVAAPDWYYNFEYGEELDRGYPFREDLLTPGYFEVWLGEGESIVFSCSLEEEKAVSLSEVFDSELARRPDKTDMISCLQNSARQFIVRRDGRTEVIAGYPWFGRWGRDTFIALPGITLALGDVESCMDVLDTMTSEMENGLFPNMGTAYNSVDAPLWFFWTLQQLERKIGCGEVWKRYGTHMKQILEAYMHGVGEHVAVHDNGLVWASHPTLAMTWMDAVVDGHPVTGRDGYQVEINALWYNAVCYTLDMCNKHADTEFVERWKLLPRRIKESFMSTFWLDAENYLADYANDKEANTLIRPNQIIACSLDHTMLSREQTRGVVATVKQHLLTPRGLRTLTPQSELYEGVYEGDQPTRDRQYHQGTVWPWLLEHYVAANFKIYGGEFAKTAWEMFDSFRDEVSSYGIGSVSEIFDGEPPHHPKGAVSQAWSVGALLRIREMASEYGIPNGEEQQ